MQKRALVIKTNNVKTYGDNGFCGAIVDGLNREVIPLNNEELARIKAQYKTLKAERDRLKARDGVRQSADLKRWKRTKAKLKRRYGTKEHGKLYDRILVTYALVCLTIAELSKRTKLFFRSVVGDVAPPGNGAKGGGVTGV